MIESNHPFWECSVVEANEWPGIFLIKVQNVGLVASTFTPTELKLESSSDEISLSKFSLVDGQAFVNPGDCVVFDLRLKLTNPPHDETYRNTVNTVAKILSDEVKSAESIVARLSYQLWTGAHGYLDMDLTSRK